MKNNEFAKNLVLGLAIISTLLTIAFCFLCVMRDHFMTVFHQMFAFFDTIGLSDSIILLGGYLSFAAMMFFAFLYNRMP